MTQLFKETTRSAGGTEVARVGHPALRHHAIARREGHGPELLLVTLRTGEDVLPLFSSGGTIRGFLASRGLGGAWYARECYAGELVSLLLGLYAGIDGVLLDPVHENAVEGYAPENFVPWETFVGYLLGDEQRLPMLTFPGASVV